MLTSVVDGGPRLHQPRVNGSFFAGNTADLILKRLIKVFAIFAIFNTE